MHARLTLAMTAFVFGTTARSFAAPSPADDKGAASRPEKSHEDGDKGKAEKGKPRDKGKPENADDKGKPANRPDHEREKDHDGKHDDKLPPGLVGRSDERHKMLLERFEERKKTAGQRREADRAEIRRRWASALDKPATREELRRHAMIVARLERIKDVADSDGKSELATRAAAALEREKALHEKRMAALASAGAASSATRGAP